MILALFVLLFAWIAFSFMSALAGFFVLLTRRKDELGIDPSAPLPAIAQPHRDAAADLQRGPASRAGAAAGDLRIGRGDRTRRAVRLVRPERHHRSRRSGSPRRKRFLQLRAELGGAASIFYRHRPENTARKSGNIDEWVTRFGADYECMLILDADSLMTGDTHRAPGRRDGAASERRADPDAADHRQRAERCSRACSSSPGGCTAR